MSYLLARKMMYNLKLQKVKENISDILKFIMKNQLISYVLKIKLDKLMNLKIDNRLNNKFKENIKLFKK